MRNVEQDDVEQSLADSRPWTRQGKVAAYIPELGHASPDMLGVCVSGASGDMISAGDCKQPFTLQSISKVISFMVALQDNGPQTVFAKVGMEPSVDPFNSIVKLESVDHRRPLNPMINAGAIAIASLIHGRTTQERLDRVCSLLQRITGSSTIGVNRKVFESEKETGDRNRALAYFMKSTGIIETDVAETLDLYFQLCAIEMDCVELSKVGLFLAHWGKLPGSGESLVDPAIVQTVLTIMMTSGMYNNSGEFFLRVGMPSKSGVSGGILSVVPNRFGIGVFGPAIDGVGNSTAGVQLLAQLSKRCKLHLMSPPGPGDGRERGGASC